MNASNIKVLVVDDEPQVITPICEYLEKHNFRTFQAYDTNAALSIWRKEKPLVVLTDVQMPGNSGLILLKKIKENYEQKTQVIIFSGLGSMDDIVESLRNGACDYLMKPVNFNILLHSINKCIERYLFDKEKEEYQLGLEQEVLKKTKELQTMFDELVDSLSRVTEIRDPYTAGHQRRVTKLATLIAKEMHYDHKRIEAIRIAGMLHDIGKISIPSEILTKPGRLTRKEFELIKEHSESGFSIIKNVPFTSVSGLDIAQVVYQHHERLDGSGYPLGLKEDQILKESRLIAVCDVIESMSSHRPYRPALGLNIALEEINNRKGDFYDAEYVEVSNELLGSFKDSDLDAYLKEVE
jgi:response regulator RpfG family c-di-GMP phosphodiesterase